MWKLTTHSPAGEHALEIKGSEPAPLWALELALQAQIEAHDETELAALGKFSVEYVHGTAPGASHLANGHDNPGK